MRGRGGEREMGRMEDIMKLGEVCNFAVNIS
jgi:hypothetical protein